jgi:microcin C transport system substrate-binding protein
VRQAFDLMFDFEWTNNTLFYGLYERSTGLYHNTPMAATALPDAAEMELLAPFRDKLPPDIFTQVYAPAKSDGSGNNRTQLLKAARLLDEAGWRIRDGKRRNAQGETLDIEFLEDSPTFERIAAPIVENMRRLGIDARMRTIDAANYANRLQGFDFDVITIAWGTAQTPGIAERNYWGSESAKATGGVNYPGVMDPAVDMLVERIANAKDRPSLITAARALDRVVMGNQYVVTQWTRSEHPIAHWNIFGRPAVKPAFNLGFLDTWWVDPAKVTALARAGRSPQ